MKKKYYPLYYCGVKQRFAKAIVVDGFVFLSGMSARDPKTGEVHTSDVREQTKIALEKIRLALEEVGSSLEKIVKMTIYVTDIRYYNAVREAELEYYREKCPKLIDEPPASTFVQVVALSKPEMFVEIDVIATL